MRPNEETEAREEDVTSSSAGPVQGSLVKKGFAAAMFIAAATYIAVTVYLFWYLHQAFSSFERDVALQLISTDIGRLEATLLARTALWKFALQSCGIISGAGFGFLGFGLFLLGIQGNIEAGGTYGTYHMLVRRMAPGSFVILVAAVLIGVCSTHQIELAYNPTLPPASSGKAMAPTGTRQISGPPKSIDASSP